MRKLNSLIIIINLVFCFHKKLLKVYITIIQNDIELINKYYTIKLDKQQIIFKKLEVDIYNPTWLLHNFIDM